VGVAVDAKPILLYGAICRGGAVKGVFDLRFSPIATGSLHATFCQGEKIKVQDNGMVLNNHRCPEEPYRLLVGDRIGGIMVPQTDKTEALSAELDRLLQGCIGSKNRLLE